jgi:hypothetical protein
VYGRSSLLPSKNSRAGEKNYSDRKDMWKNIVSKKDAKTINNQTPETGTST